MSKKKKFLRLFLPVLLPLAFLVALVCYLAVNPGIGDEIGALPDRVVGFLILSGSGFNIFIYAILNSLEEFLDLKSKKIMLTVRVSEDVYFELQEMADRTGVKHVSDVIPGVLEYVLDGLRDQEVQRND